MKILIAAYPFGEVDPESRNILLRDGHDLINNPYKRRLKSYEVLELISDCDAIIAGTEKYGETELKKAMGNLRIISRVGIGLDSVDLDYCKASGIKVAYTPDAPSQAVAELTLHHMIALSRFTYQSHLSVKNKSWKRHMGFLLSDRKIGILGLGRIGKKVCRLLKPFGSNVYVCDIEPDLDFISNNDHVILCSHEELFSQCDLISIHIPLNKNNLSFVGQKYLDMMPDNSFIINTSRGPVIDEKALISCLESKKISGAALDVFSEEPYEGELLKFNNIIFSAHIGSSALTTRKDMEITAAKAVLAYSKSLPWDNYAF